jgi:hypothetical protein
MNYIIGLRIRSLSLAKYIATKKLYIIFLTVVISMITNYDINAQVEGCTDPLANNYNPDATLNDGSCSYNITIHNPDMRYLLPAMVSETSGLAIYNGRYYTINDSGGNAELYGVDTITGEVDQVIFIQASNIDWEALAMDDEYLYIGDFGNNSGMRDDLCIYRIALNDIPAQGNATVVPDIIEFTYSDFKKTEEYTRNHNFDCEAFLASDEWLYLFSKNRGDYKTKLYKLPKQPGTYVAELITSYNVNGLVTGADISNNKGEVTLIGYTDQSWIPFIWLMWDFDGEDYFGGNKRRIDMPNILATQTEAIAYSVGKNELFTSEGHPLFVQAAYNFSSSAWINGDISSVTSGTKGNFDFTISPNPVKKKRVNIDITNLRDGDYQLYLYDTSGNLIDNYNYKIVKSQEKTRVKIKVGKFKAGVYFIKITSGKHTVEKKFIIQG